MNEEGATTGRSRKKKANEKKKNKTDEQQYGDFLEVSLFCNHFIDIIMFSTPIPSRPIPPLREEFQLTDDKERYHHHYYGTSKPPSKH